MKNIKCALHQFHASDLCFFFWWMRLNSSVVGIERKCVYLWWNFRISSDISVYLTSYDYNNCTVNVADALVFFYTLMRSTLKHGLNLMWPWRKHLFNWYQLNQKYLDLSLEIYTSYVIYALNNEWLLIGNLLQRI